jgi:hypothetical protein
MSAQKSYYFKKKSEFDAFVGSDKSESTLKLATEAVAGKLQAGEMVLTDDDPIVIFELTNTLRKSKPKPVADGIVVESNRKLGPRAKKAAPEAVETPVVEGAETAPAVDETTSVEGSGRRRGRPPLPETTPTV